MRIKFIHDTTVETGRNKYMKFVEGEVADLRKDLANDLLIMGVADYYQLDAVKIRGKQHLHKASIK